MRLSPQHDETTQRFTITIDGQQCTLDYALTDAVMSITHTGVPVPLCGRGIAAALVRAALETARARGWRVRTPCSYAAAYARKHPEFADLF